MLLSRIIRSIKRRYAEYKGGEVYINYLRTQGVRIGKNCTIAPPKTVQIDISRPYLIEIGDQVRLHRGLTLMTHDLTTLVFKNF